METDDLAAAQAAMNRTDVSARWEAEMADFFVPAAHPDLPGGRDGRDKQELALVFDIDAQLAAVDESTTPNGDTP